MTRYPPGPLAISIGDPAGIGAEVIAKCWDNRGRFELPPFVAIGDLDRVPVRRHLDLAHPDAAGVPA